MLGSSKFNWSKDATGSIVYDYEVFLSSIYSFSSFLFWIVRSLESYLLILLIFGTLFFSTTLSSVERETFFLLLMTVLVLVVLSIWSDSTVLIPSSLFFKIHFSIEWSITKSSEIFVWPSPSSFFLLSIFSWNYFFWKRL